MLYPKAPLEWYGLVDSGDHQAALLTALDEQMCPYLGRRCTKVRKSSPQQSIGSCTVGYQGRPLIICPTKFLHGHQIFVDTVKYLADAPAYSIVPEVNMPGGSVDFFVVAHNDERFIDFCGVEIQALDTTGSGAIWEARQDVLANTRQDRYGYGINWKMSAKTILMQIHHKIASFEDVGKRLYLVIQDGFWDYIVREFDATAFRPADTSHSLVVHTYQPRNIGGSLYMVQANAYGSTAAGVRLLLNLGRDHAIATEEIHQRIRQQWEKRQTVNV